MEMELIGSGVTLACLADGTTSLYFSSGGGMIGAGTRESVRKVAREFLLVAEQFVPQATEAAAFPLPPDGLIRFYLFTYSGLLSVEAEESEIQQPGHAYFPLLAAGNDVLTQLRLVDEGG
jgi:hypothetical protein